MGSNSKTLEEKMNQLPPTSRANVQNLLEFIFDKNLQDPKFLVNLETACHRTFDRYRQSAYASWQDLQQDVLFRLKSSPEYRGDVTSSTLLYKIALNILIDANRKERQRSRRLGLFGALGPELDRGISANKTHLLNEPPSNSPRGAAKKLRQTWAGALKDYREKYSSLELQKKALEWRGD